jgi:hypothetical protein
MKTPQSAAALAGAIGSLALLAGARVAVAGCNLIPGTVKTFDGAVGAANRPFAAPGERLDRERDLERLLAEVRKR